VRRQAVKLTTVALLKPREFNDTMRVQVSYHESRASGPQGTADADSGTPGWRPFRVLVEGLHRLEAAKALGEKTIFFYLVDARKH
jgi:hypothetical protein